jgi:hypothetical protein
MEMSRDSAPGVLWAQGEVVPQITFEPQITLEPQITFDPQTTFEPQTTLTAYGLLLPQITLVALVEFKPIVRAPVFEL